MEASTSNPENVVSALVCQTYVVETGVNLNLRNWGGSGDVTALLVHGSAEGGFVWDDFAPELAKICKVIALDLRGHGDSDHDPDHHYTLEKHTRDVWKVLDDLNLSNIILFGHSLGGDLVARVAPDLEESLRGLIIIESGPSTDAETIDFVKDLLRESHRPYSSIEEYAEWLRERRLLADPAVLGRLAATSLAREADGLYHLKCDPAVIDMISVENDTSWWLPALRRVEAPVLIVRGIGSAALSKRTAELMCHTVRNGELAVVPAAGHAVMNDNVDGFARAVMPFVAHVLTSG